MTNLNTAEISFEEIEADLMRDKEFKAEYDRLKPEYDAIKQNITEKISLYTALNSDAVVSNVEQ